MRRSTLIVVFIRFDCLVLTDRLIVRLEKATGVFFDAHHMKHLRRLGRWDKADGYLQHFLPTPTPKDRTTAAATAAGGPKAADFATSFDDERVLPSPHFARLQEFLHETHADQPRSPTLPAYHRLLPSLLCPQLSSINLVLHSRFNSDRVIN